MEMEMEIKMESGEIEMFFRGDEVGGWNEVC